MISTKVLRAANIDWPSFADGEYARFNASTGKIEGAAVDVASEVAAAVAALVDSAPSALNTLNELAAALGDDANFATTVATALGGKEPSIAAGTTGQYWRGDKSWQTLNAAAVFGSSLAQNGVFAGPASGGAGAGSVRALVAADISSSALGTGTPDSTTYLRGDRTWQTIAGGGVSLSAANTWTALQTDQITDSATNAVSVLKTFQHRSSGTPAAGFGSRLLTQLNSSTTADRDAASIDAAWSTATDATRTSYISLQTVSAGGALTERARLNNSELRLLGNGIVLRIAVDTSGSFDYTIARNTGTGFLDFTSTNGTFKGFTFNGPLNVNGNAVLTNWVDGIGIGINGSGAPPSQGIRIDAGSSIYYTIKRNASTGILEFFGNQTGFVGFDFQSGYVNAATQYRVAGTQVVAARGAAVPDATDAASAITQLNLLLARVRAHGLIA